MLICLSTRIKGIPQRKYKIFTRFITFSLNHLIRANVLGSFNPLTTNVSHYIETSQLICSSKSIEWFLYDGETLVVNGLSKCSLGHIFIQKLMASFPSFIFFNSYLEIYSLYIEDDLENACK